MKLLKLGTISLDGTKLHANALCHSALPHGHIQALELWLNAGGQELLALAERVEQTELPDGIDLSDAIKRRHGRGGNHDQGARCVRLEQGQAVYQENSPNVRYSRHMPPRAPVEGPTAHD